MFREMRRVKQHVSPEDIRTILSEEKRGVLSLIGDNGYPYGVPMDFYYDEEENCIYFHSSVKGHKIDAIRQCEKACFTTWNTGYQEDGDWSWYVSSIIAFGKAELVEDPDRAVAKVRKIGEKYFPTQEEVEEEMKDLRGLQMIALHIEHVTGKLVHER